MVCVRFLLIEAVLSQCSHQCHVAFHLSVSAVRLDKLLPFFYDVAVTDLVLQIRVTVMIVLDLPSVVISMVLHLPVSAIRFDELVPSLHDVTMTGFVLRMHVTGVVVVDGVLELVLGE